MKVKRVFVITAELQTTCIEFWDKLYDLESARFDLEHIFRAREWEVMKGLPKNSFFRHIVNS